MHRSKESELTYPFPALPMRTALVHDWMPVVGGAERVLAEMVSCYPSADVYTVFDFLKDEERTALLGDTRVFTSGLNKLPKVERYYRNLLLAATRAVERFDVSQYDLVLSSSTALAKGVLSHTKQHHIAYMHATTRYAWDLTHDYLATINGPLAALRRSIAHEMMHRYRVWDMRTVASVDHFVANSRFTRDRIWKFYRREAEIIHPPVDIDRFRLSLKPREEFYLTVARLVPYKNIPLIIEAFARHPERKLVVIGDGPDLARIRHFAPHNVSILGYQSEEVVTDYLSRCRAFIYAALEDFGIAPVEAQACGTPVIALNSGGTAETIRGLDRSQPTGVLFERQTVADLVGAIDTFEEVEGDIKTAHCRAQAERFSAQRFRSELVSHIQELTETASQRAKTSA
jgi:glycosyltransferase involved in cell wall biosynthesis